MSEIKIGLEHELYDSCEPHLRFVLASYATALLLRDLVAPAPRGLWIPRRSSDYVVQRSHL